MNKIFTSAKIAFGIVVWFFIVFFLCSHKVATAQPEPEVVTFTREAAHARE
jgi:hypothetical protein